jgi:hypothetical protein
VISKVGFLKRRWRRMKREDPIKKARGKWTIMGCGWRLAMGNLWRRF